MDLDLDLTVATGKTRPPKAPIDPWHPEFRRNWMDVNSRSSDSTR